MLSSNKLQKKLLPFYLNNYIVYFKSFLLLLLKMTDVGGTLQLMKQKSIVTLIIMSYQNQTVNICMLVQGSTLAKVGRR